jgi:hypothetical protein
MGSEASIGGRSGRLPMLHKQLDHDLQVIEAHQTAAGTAAVSFS